MLSSTLHVLPRTQINFQVRALIRRELAQPPVEDRFRGRHQLENDRLSTGQVRLHRSDHGRKLHAEEKLAEEALLGGFEARSRRRLGPAVEGRIFDPVDHGRQFERMFHVAVNDALSRGSGNAKERGVGAGFQGRGTKLLRIILIANLGGLWTN